ncbi:MAG: TonB family protein [Saprospiraceae bacterium]|nr:TonB family protein [Saprospiraceae bacterium]
MKKERKDESFLKQPYYKGGDKALKEFISTHLKYPQSLIALKINGSVPLRYDINHKGDVIAVHIISSLHPEFDAEAVRVVKLLKFEVPKTPRNLKVTFHKNIRIHFHFNESPADSAPAPNDSTSINLQIQYTIIQPAAKATVKPKSQPISYHYTVNNG